MSFTAVVRLAFENARLQAQLRAQLDEVRQSGRAWSKPATASAAASSEIFTTEPNSSS